MMVSTLASLWFGLVATTPCANVDASTPMLLVVPDDPLVSDAARAQLEDALRSAGWTFSPPETSARALGDERGTARRRRILDRNRLRMRRASVSFRELEDEAALDLVSDVTTELVGIHQEPGAVELLAEAHLLAGAIFLARGRVEAARTRLQRALDLQPNLDPPRDRYSPRLLAELANARQTAALRPRGELRVRARPLTERTRIYIDGRPWRDWPERVLLPLGEGRHLVRVSAPGYLSHLGSIEIRGFEVTELDVRLAPDPVVSRLSELNARLRAGDAVDELLAALSRRADADRTVAAWVGVSDDAHPDGRSPLGATIVVEGGGRAIARSLEPREVHAALGRSLRCWRSAPELMAPALALPASGRVSTNRHAKRAWFRQPWVWAAIGAVTVGVTAGVVAARANSGPPDTVEIELVPRP